MIITNLLQANNQMCLLEAFINLKTLYVTDHTAAAEILVDAFFASGEDTEMAAAVFDINNVELHDNMIRVYVTYAYTEISDTDVKAVLHLTKRNGVLEGEY